jgi:hypothetical protein
MTLTKEQSSNKEMYEAAKTSEIVNIIRMAMSQGCIRPSHVFDAVDEIICRAEAAEAEVAKVKPALERLCREIDDVIDQTADGRYVIDHDCEGVAVALEGAKVALGKVEE